MEKKKKKANICVTLWKRCLNSVGKFEGGAFPENLGMEKKQVIIEKRRKIEVTCSDVKRGDVTQEAALQRE